LAAALGSWAVGPAALGLTGSSAVTAQALITGVAGMSDLSYTETVEIFDSRVTQRTLAVARPVGPGKLRMVLTWGETPRDLDSHLDTPTGCHVFYGQKRCPDGSASLDADVTDGFGPETINVHTLRPGLYKCGMPCHVFVELVGRSRCCRYKVHAYSSGDMEASNAEVTRRAACLSAR
jgi:hypothetical protein